MNTIMKAAVITWLLDRRIKVVHVWEMSAGWTAMVETPPCRRKGEQLVYPEGQKVGCGVGKTPIRALLDALGKIDGLTLEFRLHMLEYVVEHLAQRAGPALLRRIEDAGRP